MFYKVSTSIGKMPRKSPNKQTDASACVTHGRMDRAY